MWILKRLKQSMKSLEQWTEALAKFGKKWLWLRRGDLEDDGIVPVKVDQIP